MSTDLQVAILTLVVVLPVVIYLAFIKRPTDTSSSSMTTPKDSNKNFRKSREDFVSDHYLNRRFGKRK